MRNRHRQQKWDKVWIGIITGLSVPILGFGLLLQFADWIEIYSWFGAVDFSEKMRQQTLPLVALCLNVVPMQLFNRRRMFQSMRGLIFPTILYAGIWVYRFAAHVL